MGEGGRVGSGSGGRLYSSLNSAPDITEQVGWGREGGWAVVVVVRLYSSLNLCPRHHRAGRMEEGGRVGSGSGGYIFISVHFGSSLLIPHTAQSCGRDESGGVLVSPVTRGSQYFILIFLSALQCHF